MSYEGAKQRFKKELHEYMEKNPSLRKGQATFNLMYMKYPNFVGNKTDPFYHDELTNDFIDECFRNMSMKLYCPECGTYDNSIHCVIYHKDGCIKTQCLVCGKVFEIKVVKDFDAEKELEEMTKGE
jgi:hypothetical protein